MSDLDDVEVLLVEDNRHDAELMMRALKKAKFFNKLHWAQDGVEALEFVRCSGAYVNRNDLIPPKLILLDLKMPRLNGIDVLRELKANERTRSIPIVMLTSSNEDRDIVESYRLGANGFVTKPIEFADLMDAVAKLAAFWLGLNRVT